MAALARVVWRCPHCDLPVYLHLPTQTTGMTVAVDTRALLVHLRQHNE